MKEPEFKKMIGDRMKDSDGFTYPYGAAKDGPTKKSRSQSIRSQIRSDKRKVKAQINRRLAKEYELDFDI
jgi:hypothetical protein